MDKKINKILSLAADMQSVMSALSADGVEVNTVLVSESGLSVSIRKGIEKAAVAVGEELGDSPSKTHISFGFENAYFAQRK